MFDILNSRAPVLCAVMAGVVSLSVLGDGPAQAASMAHTIPAYAGDAVRIVTPPRLSMGTGPFISLNRAHDAQVEALRRSILSVIAGQVEREERRAEEAPRKVIVQIGLPILTEDLPTCQRGLFGRVVNAPCRALPDATFPQGR